MTKTMTRPLILIPPNKSSEHLLSWKRYFEENQPIFSRIFFSIKKLTGVKNFSISKIPVYLVAVPEAGRSIEAWFSWTPKKSFITVEIPGNFRTSNADLFPVGILAHEFFHLSLRKNKKLFLTIRRSAAENKKIISKLSTGMPKRIFLEELLVSSFVPEGYLSEKFLGSKIPRRVTPEKKILAWRKFIAYRLRLLAKKCADSGKQIDAKYLNCLIRLLK